MVRKRKGKEKKGMEERKGVCTEEKRKEGVNMEE